MSDVFGSQPVCDAVAPSLLDALLSSKCSGSTSKIASKIDKMISSLLPKIIPPLSAAKDAEDIKTDKIREKRPSRDIGDIDEGRICCYFQS